MQLSPYLQVPSKNLPLELIRNTYIQNNDKEWSCNSNKQVSKSRQLVDLFAFEHLMELATQLFRI